MSRRLALAIVCSLGLPLVGEPPMTKLRVEVKNLDQKPVPRASVVARFDEGREVRKFGRKHIMQLEIRTNQEGIANFPTMPQGKVSILVIAKGYQTFGNTFDVREPEKTIAIKLNPPQPQYSSHQ